MVVHLCCSIFAKLMKVVQKPALVLFKDAANNSKIASTEITIPATPASEPQTGNDVTSKQASFIQPKQKKKILRRCAESWSEGACKLYSRPGC